MVFCKYAHFFSDFLHFDKSLLLLTVTLRGVSNKHCLLSLFSLFVAYVSQGQNSKKNVQLTATLYDLLR